MAKRADEALGVSGQSGVRTFTASALTSFAGAVVGDVVGHSTGAAITGAAVGAAVGAAASEALAARQEPVSSSQEMRCVVRYLNDNLGDLITAYLSGSEDLQTLQRWASGEDVPRDLSRERLCSAYEAAQCLVKAIGPTMTRSWFMGTNEMLSEEAPAAVLRHGANPDDWSLVVPAAQHYAEIAR
jgi:hypothetical protein